MKNILYIDKEFRTGFGGDKNRSRYIYNALDIYNRHLCIVGNDLNDTKLVSDLRICEKTKDNFFLPKAVMEFDEQELNKVVKYILNNNIDHIFIRTIAYTKLAKHIENLKPDIKIVVDVDLILSRLMEQAWTNDKSISSRYYLLESIKLRKYENSLYKTKYTFLFSSKTEVESIRNKFPNVKVKYLHNTTDLEKIKPTISSKSNVILFYGSMDSTCNMNAYKYIHNVLYPLIKDELVKKNYEIHIVGKGCEKLFSPKYKEIKIIGKVDSIEEKILSSSFIILPIHIASGTNTRVLEVAFKGKALITTPLGMEGLSDSNNKDYIAQNEYEMAKCVVRMMQYEAYKYNSALSIQNDMTTKFSMRIFVESLSIIMNKVDSQETNLVHIPRRFTISSWGGTETVIAKSANNLSYYGYNSSIYTSKALDVKKEDSVEGIVVKRFNYFYPWFGLSKDTIKSLDSVGGNLFSFSLLIALIFKKNIDIIHLHTLKRMGAIGRFVAKLKKIPYVVTLHGGYFNINENEVQHRKQLINTGLEWGKVLGLLFGSRSVLDDASAIITLSEGEYSKAYAKYGNKVEYLSNGVDVEQFSVGNAQRFKNKYNLPKTRNTILCSGRIDTQKNQLLLLQTLRELLDNGNEIHLLLVGAISDTKYYNKLNSYIEENNLKESVTMIHDLTPTNQLLIDAYHYADILVLPSQHEPFGMVILEAWAAGLVVVASKTGGIIKIINNNSNGLLFENMSKESLKEKVQLLISDNELKKLLIKNAKIDVLKYDWKEVVKSLDNIYSKILKHG